MKISIVTLVLLISALSYLAITKPVKANFEAKIFKDNDQHILPYRIHIPDNMDNNNKYPLILFLHGSGERGTDNSKQLLLGIPNILNYSRATGNQAFVIAPQLPLDQQWVDRPWDTDFHIMPEQPSLPMKLTMALLQKTIANQPIDKNRIYVTGLSIGGFGTWDILERHPELFAAAIPVCGGGDTNLAEKIKKIPVWAFHGEQDTVVKTKLSRNMIRALKNAGGTPRYTEFKGVGHDAWTLAYSDKEVLKWLFKQHKH